MMTVCVLLTEALALLRAGEPSSAEHAMILVVAQALRKGRWISIPDSLDTARRAVRDGLDCLPVDIDSISFEVIQEAVKAVQFVIAPSTPSQLCGSQGVAALSLAYEHVLDQAYSPWFKELDSRSGS